MTSGTSLWLLILMAVSVVLSDDANLTLCELVNKRNLACETHQITTSDGYILNVFRIPGKMGEPSTKKPVVWLQHGILDSSDAFVYNDDANSLSTWLAQQGYDVWLGNSRGNKYSDTHTSLHNHWWNADYWQFSWQQMGEIDVETVINYTLTVTQQEKLIYIGHSQGCTEMYVALSDPSVSEKINDKIALFISLAPVIYLPHGWPVLKTLSDAYAGELVKRLHIYAMLGDMPGVTNALKIVCQTIPILCASVGDIFAQMDPDITNWDRASIMLAREPCGTSTMQLIHYEQDMRTGKLSKYDWGSKKNNKLYGQETPPEYDITKIRVPMVWYTGGKDVYANPVDTETAREQLAPYGYLKEVKLMPEFGHLGFMWSNVSGQLYFPDLLQKLKTYLPDTQ